MLYEVITDAAEEEAARPRMERAVEEIRKDLGEEVSFYIHRGKIRNNFV